MVQVCTFFLWGALLPSVNVCGQMTYPILLLLATQNSVRNQLNLATVTVTYLSLCLTIFAIVISSGFLDYIKHKKY